MFPLSSIMNFSPNRFCFKINIAGLKHFSIYRLR